MNDTSDTKPLKKREYSSPSYRCTGILADLGLDPGLVGGGDLAVSTPIDGSVIATVSRDGQDSVEGKIQAAHEAFLDWRLVPAPKRGELIRLFAGLLRDHKDELAQLVTLESGKIFQEGLGEVQEMIDICDFAVGLSRQLYGLTMPSERPGHKMSEYWHPMGVTGVISAFNFPVAVWAWNAALALVCGDTVIWKPSEKTPITALACEHLFRRARQQYGDGPENLVQVLIGDADTGRQLVSDPRVPVISATGSTAMGRAVAPEVARRFGRCILELGGNNAMIVTPSADLELVVRAVVFAAVGTAGQRCTTLRRLIAHEDIRTELVERLQGAYRQVRIGDPFAPQTLVGPLIDGPAFERMQEVIGALKSAGCPVTGGERVSVPDCEAGYYVQPALVETDAGNEWMQAETFAPILYITGYREFDQALDLHNGVPQGLSSCIFTRDLAEAEIFISARGSDCGIANVNIGPSGAEIGGAFGGEKETGGGRESGSDAWKGYMRRCTVTVNYSSELPLAQGIEFSTD